MIIQWIEWLPDLLDGVRVSVLVAFASTALGLLLGTGVALASVSGARTIRWLSIGVVEILRGVPLLVLLYLVYFGLPNAGLTLSALQAAVAAIGLNTAAYMGEIIRGGLLSVPRGQFEASRSLGLTRTQELRKIVLPQAFRIVFPSLVSYAVIVFQATSLCYLVGVQELLAKGYYIGSITFEYLSVLTLVGLIYAAVSIIGSVVINRLNGSQRRTRIARVRPA